MYNNGYINCRVDPAVMDGAKEPDGCCPGKNCFTKRVFRFLAKKGERYFGNFWLV